MEVTIGNNDRTEKCLRKPIHTENGELWGYEICASDGGPFKSVSNGGRGAVLDNRCATAQQGEPVVERYTSLTDRDMCTEDPLFIFTNENYRNLILPYLNASDIQALRNTCKALYQAIPLPILDYDVSSPGASLEDLAKQAEKFKVIRLSVRNRADLLAMDPTIVDKVVSLEVKEISQQEGRSRDFHFFKISYFNEGHIFIKDDKKLKAFIIGQIKQNPSRADEPIGFKLENENPWLKNVAFKKCPMGLIYKTNKGQDSQLTIETVPPEVELTVNSIDVHTLKVAEMQTGSKLGARDVEINHRDKTLFLEKFVVGKVEKGVKVSESFKKINGKDLKELVYENGKIQSREVLGELKRLRRDYTLWKIDQKADVVAWYTLIVLCMLGYGFLIAMGPIGWVVMVGILSQEKLMEYGNKFERMAGQWANNIKERLL